MNNKSKVPSAEKIVTKATTKLVLANSKKEGDMVSPLGASVVVGKRNWEIYAVYEIKSLSQAAEALTDALARSALSSPAPSVAHTGSSSASEHPSTSPRAHAIKPGPCTRAHRERRGAHRERPAASAARG